MCFSSETTSSDPVNMARPAPHRSPEQRNSPAVPPSGSAVWGFTWFEPAAEAAESSEPPAPYYPTYYFFYGSLMDPRTLACVLGRPASELQQQLQPAQIRGDQYRLRMWGPYPAMEAVEASATSGGESAKSPSSPGKADRTDNNRVLGVAYRVETAEDAARLARYETDRYATRAVHIGLLPQASGEGQGEGGEEGERHPHTWVRGLVFVWAGKADELKDGAFNLKVFQTLRPA